MALDSYWMKRTARRNLLRGAMVGGVAVAGAPLLGCGSESTGNQTSSSGAPGEITDGGTLRVPISTGEPAGFDPIASATGSTQFAIDAVYSRLVRFKEAPLPRALDLELAPDLATTWDSTPDFMEWKFNLRQANWHNKAPVNGRAVVAEDVVKTLERINAQPGVYKSYMRDVLRIETPNDQTVIFKLSRPNSVFAGMLANFGTFRIMPRETAQGFDPKTEMIGSGPWVFNSYEPSRQVAYKRNDAHWTKPHFDTMVMTTFSNSVSDRLARVATGEFDMVSNVVALSDVAQARGARLVESLPYYSGTSRLLAFEALSSRTEAYDPAAPYMDERVRRAMSMVIDRPQLNKAFTVPGDKLVIDNMVAAGLQSWWLDPNGSEISREGAAVYKLDIAAAKQLMSAAGQGNGFELTLSHNATTYGDVYNNRAAAIANQWKNQLGINVKMNPLEYNQFLSTTFAGKTKGVGFILKSYFSGLEAVDTHLHSASTNNYGSVSDKEIDGLIDKAYASPVAEAQKLVKQIQDIASKKAYYITQDPDSTFVFGSPTLGGFKEYFAAGSTFASECAPFLYRKKA